MSLADEYLPLRAYVNELALIPHFPFSLVDAEGDDGFLDSTYVTGGSATTSDDEATFTTTLAWEAQPALALAAVGGASLALGLEGGTECTIGIHVTADAIGVVVGGGVTLSFDAGLFTPAELVDGSYVESESETYSIGLFGDITFDSSGNLGVESEVLPGPFFIGGTGIVVVPGTVKLCMDEDTAAELAGTVDGLDSSFRGVFIEDAQLVFPDSFPLGSIAISNAWIGTGGFSGAVTIEAGEFDLNGFPLSITGGSLQFIQNAIVGGGVSGTLTVPFFDVDVAVEIAFAMDCSFLVSVAVDTLDTAFTIPELGTLQVDSIGFGEEDDATYLLLSGTLQLELGSPAVQWPAIVVENLRIDPDGKVNVPGGWIDLPEPISVNLHGFYMEVDQLGFGNEEADGASWRWAGLSGAIVLLSNLPTSASVDGLKVLWSPGSTPRLEMSGIGIELYIPGGLYLEGNVEFHSDDEADEHYFAGNVLVEFEALGLSLDASVKIGHGTNDAGDEYTFFYLYLESMWPVGIPIFATGAAVYGISGLFGMNVYPSVSGDDWYAWYAGAPQFDVTDAAKWTARDDATAVGAGIVIGTIFDAGRAVSAKALLAVVIPGPIVFLNGQANILESRPSLEGTGEGAFDMLALFDGNAGLVQLMIEAGWKVAKLIDISASAEAYFEFADAGAWHLYLGEKEPEEKRIRADVLSLFSADAYLMLQPDGIAEGFGVSIGDTWKFGPVRLTLEAWIEAGAAITWNPVQLEGDLGLGGEFALSVAGVNMGISAAAPLSGATPAPYLIDGTLEVSVGLPWPLKDLNEEISLRWEKEGKPALEDPFESMTAAHLKTTETWALTAVEDDLAPSALDLDALTLVPLDARPTLVFDRAVLDQSEVGSGHEGYESTKVGDYVIDYALVSVVLERAARALANSADWEVIDADDIHGEWQAVDNGGDENSATRLMLYADTPFAFARQASRTYQDAFLAAHPNWPCVDAPEASEHCVFFEDAVGTDFGMWFVKDGVYFCATARRLSATFARLAVEMKAVTESGKSMLQVSAICDAGDPYALFLWVGFPEPARRVTVSMDATGKTLVNVPDNPDIGEKVIAGSTDCDPVEVEFEDHGIQWFKISTVDAGGGHLCIESVCHLREADAEESEWLAERSERLESSMTLWGSVDPVFDPEMLYRLRFVTSANFDDGSEPSEFEHFAYFRTGGPPGIPTTTAAADNEATVFPTGGALADLTGYVEDNIPEDGATAAYRAYDIGVDFNENYVERMYGAETEIQIRDENGDPLVDADGEEVLFDNEWGKSPYAILSTEEIAYLTAYEGCAATGVSEVALDDSLTIAPSSSGVVLEPERLYRAAVLGRALLFASTFRAVVWPSDSASDWETLSAGGDAAIVGTEEWEDYRVAVSVNPTTATCGIIVRYAGMGDYYRVALAPDGSWSLVAVTGGVEKSLAAGTVGTSTGDVHSISVECAGTSVVVSIDGEDVCNVNDGTHARGLAGLYRSSSAAEIFQSFMVYSTPESVHEWQFVSSRFEGFVEHMGSFAGSTYVEDVLDGDATAADRIRDELVPEAMDRINALNASLATAREALTAASDTSAPNCLAEVESVRDERDSAVNDAFNELYDMLFGDYRELPPVVELSHLSHGDTALGLLLESPEPVDWNRVEWSLSTVSTDGATSVIAGVLALWSEDGTRALFLPGDATVMFADGSYLLEMTLKLDMGREDVLLRRNGSSVSEVARLSFTLQAISTA